MRSEMKCDDAFEAMSAGLDGEIGDTERPRLRHHLQGCDRCRARDAELRAVHRQMRSALRAASTRPPERLRARIERDCTPVGLRFSPFSFGIALTGAGALGALLALAFRSPAPTPGGAELAAPEPTRPPSPRTAGPTPRAGSARGTAVLTARRESPVPPGDPAVAAESPPGAPVAAGAGPAAPSAPVAAGAGPAAPRVPVTARLEQPAPLPVPAAAPAPEPPAAASAAARPAVAAGCAPPAAPVLVQLEAPPQPATAGSPAAQATLAGCGLEPAVVTALTGQTIQLQNTGPAARQVQIDREPAPGAEFTEGEPQSLPAGGTVARRFDRPGLYPVWCDGGGQPCGYLAVAAHPQFTVVEDQPAAAAPLAVRFTAPPPAAGPRPAAVYQSRRRAVATSLTLDANGAGRLRLDPAAGALSVATLALNDCRLVRERQSPVAHACARGGIREAKRAMKGLMKRAKQNGLRFECDSCHRNETDWQLTDDARANFNSMLAAAGT